MSDRSFAIENATLSNKMLSILSPRPAKTHLSALVGRSAKQPKGRLAECPLERSAPSGKLFVTVYDRIQRIFVKKVTCANGMVPMIRIQEFA